MNNPAGVVAILLGAGGVAALAWLLIPPAPVEALVLQSSAQCLECHAAVAAEWQASHHAFAYENPEVRKLSKDFGNQECIACHAPRPVLSFEPGERVLARASDRGLGVDCLSCHAHPEGGVGTANPKPRADAPCRPRTVARMGSVEHCASCHNQHGTVDQWRAAPEALRGESCLDCHMQQVFRAGGRAGHDHAFRASHDLEALQSAVQLRGGWDGDGPWAELENSGAGHNFPTDERSRAADLQVRWQTAAATAAAPAKWSEWQHIYRFRDPYRDETDLTNTQLPSGQVHRAALEPPAGAFGGEVRLLYRTNPFQSDEEASELYRVALQP
jgi:hypothetical protein